MDRVIRVLQLNVLTWILAGISTAIDEVTVSAVILIAQIFIFIYLVWYLWIKRE